ncbi:MAG: EF-P beta-lysylation protein EpmB [Planctomycetaceae bacterium]|nr:EF-P beta-lysylation protein EpmB [Planctomycetaceae bacterium]
MSQNELSSVASTPEFVVPAQPPASGELLPWQRALKDAIRSPAELCRRLGLPETLAQQGIPGAAEFGVFVPPGYLGRIRPGDPADPLLLQVLPTESEVQPVAGFREDPVGDLEATRAPGLLQKYAGRALMVATGACAVHCRYCFRRHFPYEEMPKGFAAWEPALAELAGDAAVHEVILSGGDPLTLVDSRLAGLAERLASIPHLRRLRIHTRLPIVIPERVTDELLSWLRGTRLAPLVVVHANHPREIDRDVELALRRLVDSGIPVLNQAVLLKGVNDSAEVLAELCERLVDLRVLPYYLHQLDRVAGAAQFEVAESAGLAIVAELRRRLPGYAVPRYVRERAGDAHKWVLS